MKLWILFLMTSVVIALLALPVFSLSVNDTELVKSLSKDLSIKPEQAAGGAGAIFNYAKGKLSAEDFAKVASAVPGMDGILAAAPKAPTSGAMGALTSMGGVAALAGPFKTLGLSPDMVGKMIPQILTYVQGKGGDATKNLLANVLK
jgi:uncharacterized protein VcgC/VcgE DUF2780